MRYCRTHYLKNPLSGIKFALSVTRLAESPENDGSMLSQHSLNKGRSKRLVSAVAALSLFFGAAHVAPTASAQEIGSKFSIDEDEHGYRIDSGSTNHQIRTELFSATAQAGGEKRLAYCTEWEVNFQKTDNAYAAKWSDFPGSNSNKFKTDENVRQKINWIAANSYPAVSYETVLQKAGVNSAQVSKKSVIAQTQAAIWNLGSGFDYKGLAEGSAEEKANAKKVYEYLLGPANVGRAESTSVDLQVGFKGKDTATRQDNGTFGPFTLDTNADSVEVTAETGQVVDKNGNAFPANEIKKGQEFYFKAAETAGEAKLIAKAASSEVNGALIISKKEGGNGHHQTLIVTHDKEKTKEAELYIKWEGTNARLSTTAHKKGDEHSQRVKSKGGTIIDVVAYEGLIVGKKYTLKGQMYERVKQEDGTYKGVPTDIKAQKEFTPTQRNDEVHLEFEIPEGYAGKTLVVFEEAHGLDANGKDGSIATHTDINDENQTIYVNQPYQDMSSDSSAAKTGSAGAMFAGSSKCFSGGAAGGSSKKEDKNKGSLGDLFAGSSSLFGGDKDKDKGGSDSNNGSTNGGNGQDNGGSNTQNGSNGGTTDSSSNKDKKDNGSTGGGDSNGNGGGNGDANGGSDTKTGSNAGGDAGSGGGAGSSGKDKKDNGSNTSSSGDNKGDGKGEGGSDGKSGSGINSTSDTKGGSAGGAGSSGNGKGDGNGGSTAGSSGEGKGQGNGGANGGSDTQNGSDPENKNGSAALAGSTSGGADCGALALGALVIGGLVLTATGFSVLPKNAAPAPLAGAADPKSDTKGAAPAAGDPNNKNATNSNTKGAEPKEKGVAHKDPNTSKMDVKSASPAKSNSALANTGVSGILIMLAIAAVAAVAGGALIFFGRRKKN